MTPEKEIARVLADYAAIPELADRASALGAMLNAVPALQRSLREMRQEAAVQMRTDGADWAEVMAALGVSRTRAREIVEGVTTRRSAAPRDAPVAEVPSSDPS